MAVKKNGTKELTEEENIEIEENTKKASFDIFMGYMPYLIIIFFVVIIRMFIATPVKVNGSSMYPTLKNGDTMLLYKLRKKIKGISRFDIVVVETDSGKLIKRVIALPGEKVSYKIEIDDEGNSKGVLYINDEVVEETFIDDDAKVDTCNEEWDICEGEITVGENEYFVMGDNRGNSKDSRIIGTVNENDILGTTEIILFPFDRIGKVD